MKCLKRGKPNTLETFKRENRIPVKAVEFCNVPFGSQQRSKIPYRSDWCVTEVTGALSRTTRLSLAAHSPQSFKSLSILKEQKEVKISKKLTQIYSPYKRNYLQVSSQTRNITEHDIAE